LGSAEPQVCSTEVMPILAPGCFGSAAIVSMSATGSLRGSRRQDAR
jgi:hypothetical protein